MPSYIYYMFITKGEHVLTAEGKFVLRSNLDWTIAIYSCITSLPRKNISCLSKNYISCFFISGIALKEMCNGFEQFRYKLLSYADDKQNNSTIINFLQLFLREYCYRLSKISFTIQVQNTWNRRIKHFSLTEDSTLTMGRCIIMYCITTKCK